MADYVAGATTPTTPYGNFSLGKRVDAAADQAGANNANTVAQFDSAGGMRCTDEGGKPTYYATSQFACDSTGTDIATFTGVAGKTAKILRIIISSTATAAATGDVSVIRRSAANTAGTAVSASVGLADTGDAAASVTPKHYTAHPTGLGTSAGTLQGKRFVQQAAGTPQASEATFDFTSKNGCKGLRVQGTTDIIAVNVAAALGGAGNAWDITWVWTEEPTTA